MNFKKYFNRFLILLFTFLFSGIVFAQHPKDLQKPSPIKFKPLKPAEFTLSNGIKVYYLENKELPLISLNGLVRAGSLYELADKTGLASMMGNIMRTGGTKNLTGDKIDEELEKISANIETNIGTEFGGITSECLKKDFKRVLEIFSDIILNPEFRQEKIDLFKNQSREGIRRRWDRPERAAGELFNEKVYGTDNCYGDRTTFKTINNITREDMIDFHKKYFVPNNFYLMITGDISLAEAKSSLEAAFKGWIKKDVKFPEIPPLVEKCDGSIYYAYQETPQANIYLGHLGVRRNNPDQFKIELMNTILGGGFTARLMKELRSNRGLTYGIRGGVTSGKDKGLFQISSQLKAEKCVEAMTLIKDIIKEMQEKPVTDQEIEQAKNYINNSFVFRFEQKDRYLAQYVNQKLSGYPDNYFENYLDNIKKVSKKDIQDAAKKHLNPDKMIFVIVGDEKKFDKPLSSFGKVVPIDLKQIMKNETAK